MPESFGPPNITPFPVLFRLIELLQLQRRSWTEPKRERERNSFWREKERESVRVCVCVTVSYPRAPHDAINSRSKISRGRLAREEMEGWIQRSRWYCCCMEMQMQMQCKVAVRAESESDPPPTKYNNNNIIIIINITCTI